MARTKKTSTDLTKARRKEIVIHPHRKSDRRAAGRQVAEYDSRATGADTAAQKALPMNYAQQAAVEHPTVGTNLNPIFERARYYKRESSFLQMFMPLRRAIVNYGFRLRPLERGKDRTSLDKWLQADAKLGVDEVVDPETRESVSLETTSTNQEMVFRYVQAVIDEFTLFDNVISMWTDGLKNAITLQIEKCTYSDLFGTEILRYTHGLASNQIDLLPEDMQPRFRENPVIVMNPDEGEHFKVLTRTSVGEGFGVPSLFSIFRLLGEVESKEVGQNAMAFALRTVKRWHKIGHEIKGPNSGKYVKHANWTRVRSDAVKRQWIDTVGFDEYTSNWDEEIVFPWPDLKVFDDLCWKGSDRRLYSWAGPIGQMIIAKGVTPYLTNLVKAWTLEERQKLGIYLSSVINRAFGPPVPITVAWSDTIFTEARLAAELMKFAAQQGLASVTTTKREFGLNSEEEEDLKMTEADDPDAIKKFTPIWDMSHAITPALGQTAATLKQLGAPAGDGPAPGKKNGKPAGTKDKR